MSVILRSSACGISVWPSVKGFIKYLEALPSESNTIVEKMASTLRDGTKPVALTIPCSLDVVLPALAQKQNFLAQTVDIVAGRILRTEMVLSAAGRGQTCAP
jgi:hypothetical protein